MMMPVDFVPEVRYARSGTVNIAYQRWGQGSHVIVFTPPLASNVELFWENPEWARVLRHAGEYAQCVMLDKRGVGLSDRVTDPPSLSERVVDTLAVMDAEDLARVELIGQSEGGAIAIALAAEHPERVRSMVLVDSTLYGVPDDELAALADDDHPFPTQDEQTEMVRSIVRHWGSADPVNLELFAPSVASDPGIRRWYQRFERQSASPGAILGFFRSLVGYDLRPLLARLQTPTLVTQSRGDRVVHVAHGRHLASAIGGASYIEYDNADHLWELAPEWRRMQDDTLEFVTGHRPMSTAETAFAIVVFTDIVDSTAREGELGDRAWRILLERHDRLGHELVIGGGGRVIKHTGDGLLATFTDPAAAVSSVVDLSRQLAAIGLPLRAGLHAGVIEVHDSGDVSGIAVNIAARVQGRAEPGEVLVSETLRDLLLGSSFRFDDRGEQDLKGLDRPRRLYAITNMSDTGHR